MRGNERDEYEDLDEYEEEGEEQEEEDGEDEEEVPMPTKDVLEYLELRQRLKESIRKKMENESDSDSVPLNSRDRRSKIPNDSFGSFFGPSQPVIAQRVIQESKSLLENPQLVARVCKESSSKNNGCASASVRSKPQTDNHLPAVRSCLKNHTKIQMVKNTRDYSFLLSDDAELPAPAKDQPPRSVTAPKSGGHFSSRKASCNGKRVPNGREERKPLPPVSQMRAKVGSQRPASSSKQNMGSVDPRRQLGNNYACGPGRPSVPKGMSSKSQFPFKESGAKSPMAGDRKPVSANLQSSVPKQSSERRKDYREANHKIIDKRPITSSKLQPQMRQQHAKSFVRPTSQKERPKKRPPQPYDDNDDDVGSAISMIRNMLGYNPNKYCDSDGDDDVEVANLNDIEEEESYSLKIAEMEDEEELRKIQEEERRERMRRKAKKRIMSR